MRSRVMVAALVGVAAGVLIGAPARAHVEVEADKPQAGATDVTVSFSSEAESDRAGVVSVQVVLPAGIAAADVTLAKGPTGWALTRKADGFLLAGKALPVGRDAAWSIKIKQLPYGVTQLPFKVLVTYGDGEVHRWIELPGDPGSDNPAPVLKVRPAPSLPPSAPPTTAAAPTTSAAAPPPTSAAPPTTAPVAVPASNEDSGMSPWLWILIAAAAAAVGAVGVGALMRRRSAS